MKERYIILQSGARNDLERQVNILLDEGYVLVGRPFISPNINITSGTFFQALVLDAPVVVAS